MDIRTKVYFQAMDKVWHWNSISHPNIPISRKVNQMDFIPYVKKNTRSIKIRNPKLKMKHPIIQPRGKNH